MTNNNFRRGLGLRECRAEQAGCAADPRDNNGQPALLSAKVIAYSDTSPSPQGIVPAGSPFTEGTKRDARDTGMSINIENEINCSVCGKDVTRRYWTCDEEGFDEHYCDACFARHPCKSEHNQGCATLIANFK